MPHAHSYSLHSPASFAGELPLHSFALVLRGGFEDDRGPLWEGR